MKHGCLPVTYRFTAALHGTSKYVSGKRNVYQNYFSLVFSIPRKYPIHIQAIHPVGQYKDEAKLIKLLFFSMILE